MSKAIDYSKWDEIEVSSEESLDEASESVGATDDYDPESMFEATYAPVEKSDGWLKVGHVLVHPEDTGKAFYSPTVLREDPKTFVPDPSDYSGGQVVKWGIPDCCDYDLETILNLSFIHSNSSRLYGDLGNPTEQFIKVLEKRKLEFSNTSVVQEALASTFVLRISLCQNEQDCWRQVRVPAAIDLSKLHDQVIVPAMGWARAYHGYVFEDPTDGSVLGPKKHASSYIDMMHAPMHYYYVMDDRRVPLAAVLREEGDFVFYTYDLGDQWAHRIELEQIIETDQSEVILLDGVGACPPEDSNGLEGKGCRSYAEFLKAYKKNPKKLKMKEAVREVERHASNYSKPWMGPPIKFKPLEFNIDRHRLLMNRMIAGPSVKKSGMVGSGEFKESMRGCNACGDRLKALMKCAKCGKRFYCSRECQVDDWKNGGHKQECKKLRAGVKTG